MEQELYFLRSSEQYIAKELLLYAAGLKDKGETLETHPELEQYERNFGSFNGDIGVYMIADKKVAGGAWVRMLAKGLGHVDHDTPELLIAVKPDFRNQGIGRTLINQLFIEVSKIYTQVSLSVPQKGPEAGFFETMGFKKLPDSEHTNSRGESSIKMLKVFEKEYAPKEEKGKSLEEECFRKSFRPIH